MDSKQENKAKVDDKEAFKGLKVKKTRHFRREVIMSDAKVLVTKVMHVPVKGEVISDTRRTDQKFNRDQKYTAGNRSL